MKILKFKSFFESVKINDEDKTFVILSLSNENTNLTDISKISKNFSNDVKNVIKNLPKSLGDLCRELFSEKGFGEEQTFEYVEDRDLNNIEKNLQTSANVVFSTKYNIQANVEDNKVIENFIKRISDGVRKGSKNMNCNVLLFSTNPQSNSIEIYMNNKWQKNDALRKLYLGK